MGSKARQAQQARAHRRRQRLSRAESAARGGAASRTRATAPAVAEVRNALRARDRCLRAATTAEQRAGSALRQLTGQGVSLREIASRCGLSVAVVRRLLAVSSLAQVSGAAAPSTDRRRPDAHAGRPSDLPTDAGAARH